MPNLQFLPSIRDSETITCPQCKTVQFPKRQCSRCLCNLNVNYLTLSIDTLLDSHTEDAKQQLARSIGDLLRSLRKRRGICQSQLANRTAGSIARTSLSKVENGRMLLPVYKLLPLAKALGLTGVILRFEVDRSGTARMPNER